MAIEKELEIYRNELINIFNKYDSLIKENLDMAENLHKQTKEEFISRKMKFFNEQFELGNLFNELLEETLNECYELGRNSLGE